MQKHPGGHGAAIKIDWPDTVEPHFRIESIYQHHTSVVLQTFHTAGCRVDADKKCSCRQFNFVIPVHPARIQ